VWTNYHCHSNYCDGKGALEDYVLSAIEKGMPALGFSSHAPLPFENTWSMKAERLNAYVNEIALLKEKYQSKIGLYTSLEIDFIDGLSGVNSSPINGLPLDYTLCSVHFLGQLNDGRYCEIEGSTTRFMQGLDEIWQGDQDEMVKAYFQAFHNMLATSRPTIIGHLDKIKLHRSPNGEGIVDVNSKTYREEAIKCLEAIAKTETFLEINTRALYKKNLEEPYPSLHLLQIARELKIPFVLNSDSHQPSELDSCFEQVAGLLLKADISTLKTLRGNQWIDARLTPQGLIL
jgi:histidinol-phosphatase (PHP family)